MNRQKTASDIIDEMYKEAALSNKARFALTTMGGTGIGAGIGAGVSAFNTRKDENGKRDKKEMRRNALKGALIGGGVGTGVGAGASTVGLLHRKNKKKKLDDMNETAEIIKSYNRAVNEIHKSESDLKRKTEKLTKDTEDLLRDTVNTSNDISKVQHELRIKGMPKDLAEKSQQLLEDLRTGRVSYSLEDIGRLKYKDPAKKLRKQRMYRVDSTMNPSVDSARSLGVPMDKIIHNVQEGNKFFTGKIAPGNGDKDVNRIINNYKNGIIRAEQYRTQ